MRRYFNPSSRSKNSQYVELSSEDLKEYEDTDPNVIGITDSSSSKKTTSSRKKTSVTTKIKNRQSKAIKSTYIKHEDFPKYTDTSKKTIKNINACLREITKLMPEELKPYAGYKTRKLNMDTIKLHGIENELYISIKRWARRNNIRRKLYVDIPSVEYEYEYYTLNGYNAGRMVISTGTLGEIKYVVFHVFRKPVDVVTKTYPIKYSLYMDTYGYIFKDSNFIFRRCSDCDIKMKYGRIVSFKRFGIDLFDFIPEYYDYEEDDKKNVLYIKDYIQSIYDGVDKKVNQSLLKKTIDEEYDKIEKKYGIEVTNYLFGRESKRHQKNFKRIVRKIMEKLTPGTYDEVTKK